MDKREGKKDERNSPEEKHSLPVRPVIPLRVLGPVRFDCRRHKTNLSSWRQVDRKQSRSTANNRLSESKGGGGKV